MKTRIISGIVMALGVGTLLYLGGTYWVIFMSLLSLVAVWEFINMRKTKKDFPLLMKIITYLAVLGLVIYSAINKSGTFNFNYGILAGFFIIFLLPIVFINDNDKYNVVDAFFLMGTALFLGIALSFGVTLRNLDIVYIIYLVLITVLTDTFAYVTGNLVGTRKLCEKISPNKTIEGVVGGLFMGTVIPSIYYLTIVNQHINVFLLVGITLILSLVGQCGDLLFSSVKRYYGKKDYSDIIPGHGGVLDRLDSIIFVVLAFAIVMQII